MARFTMDTVSAHIRRKHPGCPEFAVTFFSAEVAGRDWKACSIGKAVGITMQTYLRHNMTDYDQLILEGVDRLEARRRVQPRVERMIASWAPKKRRRLGNEPAGQG